MIYYRPIAMHDSLRTEGAQTLAGGWCWFSHAERIERDGRRHLISAAEIPPDIRARLTASRPAIAGLPMDRPRLMGILNTTPDSFSDGGLYNAPDAAFARARAMIAEGADLLDLGGESTRPGADDVPISEEIARTAPVIAALRRAGVQTPLSIDTRKAAVAAAALQVGANMVNDVAALQFDPALSPLVAAAGVPVCLMHSIGTPKTMQSDPRYDDVLLDVYDALSARIAAAEQAGIARKNILIDPGIGFGKTVAHNLALIRGLSLFHGLGCALLLGASRKRFIGTLTGADIAEARLPGSLAVALAGVAQGVQMLRIHDVAATRQALTLWQSVTTEGPTR